MSRLLGAALADRFGQHLAMSPAEGAHCPPIAVRRVDCLVGALRLGARSRNPRVLSAGSALEAA